MRGIFLAALMALVWLGAGAAHAADPAAENFVKGIYANYTGTGMTALGVPLDSEAVINRYFDPSLAKLILDDRKAAGDDVPTLDGDPFINAQDWEIKALVVHVDDNGPGKATATVRFKNFGEDKTIKLSLVRVGAQWKISDIEYFGADAGTLRGLFQHH